MKLDGKMVITHIFALLLGWVAGLRTLDLIHPSENAELRQEAKSAGRQADEFARLIVKLRNICTIQPTQGVCRQDGLEWPMRLDGICYKTDMPR